MILPYVYKLTHKETRQFYIGVRYGNKYPALLDLGKRYWSSSKIVKPKFDEYDICIIAEFFNREDAIDFEQKLIEDNWNDPLILNKAIQVSKTFRCIGHTDATRLKMSNAKKGKAPNNKGKPMSVETKEKIRIANTGKKHSNETIQKLSQLMTGNTWGFQKGNPGSTGRPCSDETKKKISNAGKGRIPSAETKKKQSLASKGIPKNKSECPYCKRLFSPVNMSRYHGSKCKLCIDSQ